MMIIIVVIVASKAKQSINIYRPKLSINPHRWPLSPSSSLLLFFDRLYCYAQKHVRSIKAVTKDPGEIAEKRYRSIRRLNKPNKKLKIRNLHHSSPYHVSDHKAAITVGVIMGVFLGKLLEMLHKVTCLHSTFLFDSDCNAFWSEHALERTLGKIFIHESCKLSDWKSRVSAPWHWAFSPRSLWAEILFPCHKWRNLMHAAGRRGVTI